MAGASRQLATAVAVSLLAACGPGSAPASSASIATAEASELAGDEQIFAELQTHTSAWNRIVGPVVEGYLDPEVSADAWVAQADAALPELRRAVASMRLLASGLNDDKLGDITLEIVDTYQAKAAWLTRMKVAVDAEDADAEVAAAEQLGVSGEDAQRLGTELIRLMRDRGMSVDDLITELNATLETVSNAPVPSPEVQAGKPSPSRPVDFTEVSGASGRITVEVPLTWEVISSPMENPTLLATPDISAFEGGDGPGLLISLLRAGLDHAALLDELAPVGCTSDPMDYDDGLYVGVSSLYSSCGDLDDLGALVVVADANDADATVVVFLQYDVAEGSELLGHIVETFVVS